MLVNNILFLDASAVLVKAVENQISRQAGLECSGVTCADPSRPEGVSGEWDVIIADPTQSAQRPQDIRQALLDLFGPHELLAYLPENAGALARRCLQADFAGAVSRHRGVASLCCAAEAVVAGGLYVDGTFGMPDSLEAEQLPGCDGLSSRETEIMLAIARGNRPKQIAGALGISSKTVETHKYRAMSKLGLRDQSGLIAHALHHGWQG